MPIIKRVKTPKGLIGIVMGEAFVYKETFYPAVVELYITGPRGGVYFYARLEDVETIEALAQAFTEVAQKMREMAP